MNPIEILQVGFVYDSIGEPSKSVLDILRTRETQKYLIVKCEIAKDSAGINNHFFYAVPIGERELPVHKVFTSQGKHWHHKNLSLILESGRVWEPINSERGIND